MPGGDHISVRPDDLFAHAATVDVIASEGSTAKQAGQAARPDMNAYGKWCVIVPALLGELQSLLVDSIGMAAQSFDETAQRLRTAAQGYQSADEASAAAHRAAGSGL